MLITCFRSRYYLCRRTEVAWVPKPNSQHKIQILFITIAQKPSSLHAMKMWIEIKQPNEDDKIERKKRKGNVSVHLSKTWDTRNVWMSKKLSGKIHRKVDSNSSCRSTTAENDTLEISSRHRIQHLFLRSSFVMFIVPLETNGKNCEEIHIHGTATRTTWYT